MMSIFLAEKGHTDSQGNLNRHIYHRTDNFHIVVHMDAENLLKVCMKKLVSYETSNELELLALLFPNRYCYVYIYICVLYIFLGGNEHIHSQVCFDRHSSEIDSS